MLETMIVVRVNGENREISDGLTVDGFLRSLQLQPAMVVVERNGDILRRERYGEIRVEEGDALELVHFVGGG
jgi:thiazole synthase